MFNNVSIILSHKKEKNEHAIGRAYQIIRQPSTLKVTKSRSERISVKLPGFGYRYKDELVGGVNLHQFKKDLRFIEKDNSKNLAFYEKMDSNRHRFTDDNDEDVLPRNLTIVNSCVEEVLGRNQSAQQGESSDARHSATAAAVTAESSPLPRPRGLSTRRGGASLQFPVSRPNR